MREGAKEPVLAKAYMNLAIGISEAATCVRASHGCVLVTDDLKHIVGLGYNGPATGLANQCARPYEAGNCGCIHAEANACFKCNHDGPKIAFITGYPCERCAGALIQCNVQLVVYNGPAHREMNEGIILLKRKDIMHIQIDDWVDTL